MIRKAAVLGAGTMGTQIAAHIANSGFPVILLDLTTDQVRRALQNLKKSSPPALFLPEHASRIEFGNFAEDLSKLQDADWVVEAVVEDRAIKRKLLEQVDAVRKPGSVVTTNTSGLSIAELAGGRSVDFRRHWFGTHFFNPPRYMRLLEVIPTRETSPDVLREFEHFADLTLGKAVVRAKDTPNFIANRIGVFAALQAILLMQERGFTIEETDWLTGPLIGRPKSATFRTLDLAGIDLFVQAARNMQENVPEFITAMVERKMLGGKAGRGFYKKENGETLVLDIKTFEYRPQRKPGFPSLETIASAERVSDRLTAIFALDDRPANYVKDLLDATIQYATARQPEIANDKVSVDRAMRWGFAWETGPFETSDLLRKTRTYHEDDVPLPAGWTVLSKHDVIRQNPEAILRDLGDGVACLEFHSKMNSIGGDILSMLFPSLEEVNVNFQGLVIGNQGTHFSAGANLVLLMTEAAGGNWDEIDRMIRTFQQATQAIKYNPKPVVAAPFGMALGGGCEFVMSAAYVQAAAETYMGLVETGVGLIPAGGGTAEMLARAATSGGAPKVREVFENIVIAKVSSSAEDARRLLYLRPGDGITMNSARVIADAKSAVLRLAAGGYHAPLPQELPVFGSSLLALLKLGVHLRRQAEQITDHEANIARKLAFVLCGGDVTASATAPEQYFLDMEREAFVSLCGESKTLARIEHVLKKGKVLRN